MFLPKDLYQDKINLSFKDSQTKTNIKLDINIKKICTLSLIYINI